MIQRYSRPVMRQFWTEENKLRIWLQIELLASEALASQGTVPEADFRILKAGLEQCARDPDRLADRARELEKTLNHDVIPSRLRFRSRSTIRPVGGCILA